MSVCALVYGFVYSGRTSSAFSLSGSVPSGTEERTSMESNENTMTVTKNGTTFTVVMKSAENAQKSFEDLMRDMITREAVTLPPDEARSA